MSCVRMAVATAVLLVASAAPADGRWTRKAGFPFTATRQPLSVSTADRGYVGNPSLGSRAFWRYDLNDGSWNRLGDPPADLADRVDCSGFALGQSAASAVGRRAGSRPRRRPFPPMLRS